MDIKKTTLEIDEYKLVETMVKRFIGNILDQDILDNLLKIDDVKKISVDRDNTYYHIWFEVTSCFKAITNIYDSDYVYLRGDLREKSVERPYPYQVKMGCILPINDVDKINDHYDRNENAWKLYEAVYVNEIHNRNLKLKKATFKYGNNNEIDISGDCDFNFNVKKYIFFKNIINEAVGDNKYKEHLVKLLNVCKRFHHSPKNISIMPQTAKLNHIKQSIGNDRLDTFIWALDLYYKGSKAIILANEKCSTNVWLCNRNILQEYLDSFGNDIDNTEKIYVYCKKIYHINRDLVDRLIKSGSKPIDSLVRINEYFDLAYAFWDMKEHYYLHCAGEDCRTQYFINIKSNPLLLFSTYINDELEYIMEEA